MAKLSAHGTEIGRIKYTTKIDAYFSDGKVLRNEGFGWKLKFKVKEGRTPQEAYDKAITYQQEKLANRPFFKAYRKELHSIAGISKAWKLHAAVQVMHDDPDGAWSETCDGYGDNVSADIDEVSELCRLYELAMSESKEIKAASVTA